MNIQYVSIRRILDSVLRHPLLADINLETAIDYTVDFIKIVGVPSMFIDKIASLKIEDYRGKLPDDFHEIIQVKLNKEPYTTFRYTTDNFHLENKEKDHINLTYKIQGNIIFTSPKETELTLSYRAINVDECGLPMIPDNSNFIRALNAYIKKQHFTILFDLGKISPAILQNTQQEYAWAVGACESEFQRLTLDEAESFYNSWRTLLIKDNEHSRGFITNGDKERLKI